MGQTILKICFAFLILIFSSNCVQANENINTGFVELTADETQTVVGGYSDTTNAILYIIAGTGLIASAVVLTTIALPVCLSTVPAGGVMTPFGLPIVITAYFLLFMLALV